MQGTNRPRRSPTSAGDEGKPLIFAEVLLFIGCAGAAATSVYWEPCWRAGTLDDASCQARSSAAATPIGLLTFDANPATVLSIAMWVVTTGVLAWGLWQTRHRRVFFSFGLVASILANPIVDRGFSFLWHASDTNPGTGALPTVVALTSGGVLALTELRSLWRWRSSPSGAH